MEVLTQLTIFVLATFVGFEIITKVPPTLHTPLMSGSNAISGITVVGAILASFGGTLFAAQIGSVFPHTFDIVVSITVLVIIIVGGMGSVPGVTLGAIVLIVLPNLLREFSEYQFLFYGVLLIVMMLKRPEGFIPSRRRAQELHAEELSQDAWLEIYGEKGQPEQVMGTGHGASPARFRDIRIGSGYAG